jgi:pantetheine-phosphate adenylyltransferase
VTRAVYPGTFDPFTPGHLDVAARARALFTHLTILVAVNAGKSPSGTVHSRAAELRAALPPHWTDVEVAAWPGLTTDYCLRHGATAIVRGVRNQTDFRHEYELAAMNQSLGVTTLLLPTTPALATVSSTALRALG